MSKKPTAPTNAPGKPTAGKQKAKKQKRKTGKR
jgi:hypothetical protein